MGAWGPGIMQDDTALDFLDALREDEAPIERMRAALEEAPGAEYLEYDAAHAALVSAAVVDAVARGGTIEGDEELRPWLATLDSRAALALRAAAARACARVLAPGSELQELWAEAEEDGPRWAEQVSELARRLSA